MFVIDARVTKDDVLEYLTLQLQRGEAAVIFLLELPSFLASKIAFSAFLTSIHSYPRPITWQTNNLEIADMIRTTSVVEQGQSHTEHAPSKTVENQIRPVQSGFLFVQKKSEPVAPQDTAEDELDKWAASIETTRKTFSKDWFRAQLSGGAGKQKQELSTPEFVTHSPYQGRAIGTARPRWIVVFISILLACGVLCLLWWYLATPTLLSTVTRVHALSHNASHTVKIAQKALESERLTPTVTSSITPTGASASDAQTARGKILLINRGTKPFDLNNAGFFVFSGSSKYIVSKNSSLDDTFTLPPASESEQFSFDIRAARTGVEYELALDSLLTVTNLILQDVGPTIQAKVIQTVRTHTQDRRFTTEDSTALSEQNATKNTVLTTSALAQGEAQYPHRTYISTLATSVLNQTNTTASIQDFTEKVEQTSTYATSLFFVEHRTLASVAQANDRSIASLTDITNVQATPTGDTVQISFEAQTRYTPDMQALQKKHDNGLVIPDTDQYEVSQSTQTRALRLDEWLQQKKMERVLIFE
jgi:hypothetical protein